MLLRVSGLYDAADDEAKKTDNKQRDSKQQLRDDIRRCENRGCNENTNNNYPCFGLKPGAAQDAQASRHVADYGQFENDAEDKQCLKHKRQVFVHADCRRNLN